MSVTCTVLRGRELEESLVRSPRGLPHLQLAHEAQFYGGIGGAPWRSKSRKPRTGAPVPVTRPLLHSSYRLSLGDRERAGVRRLPCVMLMHWRTCCTVGHWAWEGARSI
jgi:hypothetical protein